METDTSIRGLNLNVILYSKQWTDNLILDLTQNDKVQIDYIIIPIEM